MSGALCCANAGGASTASKANTQAFMANRGSTGFGWCPVAAAQASLRIEGSGNRISGVVSDGGRCRRTEDGRHGRQVLAVHRAASVLRRSCCADPDTPESANTARRRPPASPSRRGWARRGGARPGPRARPCGAPRPPPPRRPGVWGAFQPFDERLWNLVADDHDAQHAVLPQKFGGSGPSRFDGGVTGPGLGHARRRAASHRGNSLNIDSARLEHGPNLTKAFRSIFRMSPLGSRPMSLSSVDSNSDVSFPTSMAAPNAWTSARTATDTWSLANHPAYRSSS